MRAQSRDGRAGGVPRDAVLADRPGAPEGSQRVWAPPASRRPFARARAVSLRAETVRRLSFGHAICDRRLPRNLGNVVVAVTLFED